MYASRGTGAVSDQPSLADDQRYIAGALDGDVEALEHVLRSSQEWAYHVAYRVLGREADARDAVQDAFLLTVRALRGDGSPPRNTEGFRPWLRRVVVNAALTQVRSRPKLQSVPVDVVAESLPGSDRDEPGRATEREETRGHVLQALLALPESQRAALALRELLDASYEEIAEVLEIPPTAVGTLLFRARAGFRTSYDHIAETSHPVDCPDIMPLFSAIIDSQPRPAAWRDLERHLRACDRCQDELAGQRRARRLYALIPLGLLPATWNPATDAIAGIGGAESSAGHATSLPDNGANVPSSTPPATPEPSAQVGQVTPPPDLIRPELASGALAAPAGGSADIAATASGSAGAAGAVASTPTAGLPAASATTAAANTVAVAATAAPTVSVAGPAASAAVTTAGLAGMATSAKLGIAAFAAAAVVGGAVLVGQQLPGDETTAGVPSPIAMLAGSPVPSPNVALSPSAAAGPSPVGAQPSPPSVSASPSPVQPASASTPVAPSSGAQLVVTGSPPAPSPAQAP